MQALMLALLLPAAPVRADISDSGNLTIGGTGVVQGTMTVQGNTFSVGGTTFSVAGGSVTLGGRLNAAAAGIKWADGTISTTASGGGSAASGGWIVAVDTKAANIDGGTCTSGSWVTRTLTGELADTQGDATLASNQLTLVAGTYRCFFISQGYRVDRLQARLRNVTDGTTLGVGLTGFSTNGSSTANASSSGFARFTLASSKAIELQFRCQTTATTFGLGLASNFGEDELYSMVECEKE